MRGGRELKVENFRKRDGDGEFRIEEYGMFKIPYIFFGEILIQIQKNSRTYNHFYKYVIYNAEHFGSEVRISELDASTNIDVVKPIEINKAENNEYHLRDKLNKLYNELKKNSNNYKRIQKFIKNKLNIRNGNDSAQGNVRENGPAQVSKPIILSNGCIKYPANYQFSGKINGTAYNTNKLFRGTGNNHLYLYDPRKGKYELLLTELDYLVNIYGTNGKPFMITYSGLFQLPSQTEPSQIQAGKTKIPITDIDHYLYCSNMDEFPKEKYKIRPIYIKELWRNTTTYHNVDINDPIQFPCWIIFKPSQENNFTTIFKKV
jgi:hypothetical protein